MYNPPEPMTEADLTRIETTLGIILPEPYRKFAQGLIPNYDAYAWCPFINVEEIIERNQTLRSGDIIDGWKPELFVIGAPAGDYFIDVTDLSKGVFLEISGCGGGKEGGYYKPDDYSSCHICSFDEFIRQ